MRVNGSGRHQSNLSELDKLPLPIKKVLWSAPRSYAPHTVRAAWKKSGMTSQNYADRMVIKLMIRFKGWKPDTYIHTKSY